MDTATSAVNRLMDLASDSPPWEQAIEEMGRAVRDHVIGDLQNEVRSCEYRLLTKLQQEVGGAHTAWQPFIQKMVQNEVRQELASLKEQINDLKKILETLPAVIRVALEGIPDVVVQTPQPQQVHKKINYDVMNRPSDVVETRVF